MRLNYLRRIFSAFGIGRPEHKQRDVLLSKSKYLVGLQCPKALWIHYNDKGLVPTTDATTAALFEQGHEVGLLAQRLFPAGIHVGFPDDLTQATESTRIMLCKKRPVFEAALCYKRCFSRADILVPVKKNQWDILEVKSSTTIKQVYFHDLAFQRYVCEGAGLLIRNCYLMHVNNAYVKSGEIDPNAFFSKIDVTRQVAEVIPAVKPNILRMLHIIASEKCPDIRISPHCDRPYECALKPICWRFLPQPNIFDLRNGRQKRWALFARGVLRLEDIPSDFPLSDIQCRQVRSHRTGVPYVDREAIRGFVERLEYPLYFLDFETVGPAIPLFNQSKPYGQIPFQFSLHVKTTRTAQQQYYGFLADGTGDPRPAFLADLRRLLGERGTIVGYNIGFEIARLRECAEAFPEYQGWFEKVRQRFMNLLDVFGLFAYYHPAQNGSASLKAVLPAITGRSYGDLEIQEGGTASREFMRIMFNHAASGEREQVRQQLEAYCRQDTQALIDILCALQEL